MALKQADKDKLKKYGFDVDKLIEAIKADAETDIDIADDVTVIKTADLEIRDANKLAEGKRLGETEGEKKGKELAAKAFKKKFALEDSIPADVEKVVDAVNTKLNKGDQGLQEQIALLQRDKEALIAEKAQLETSAKQAALDAQIIGMFPAKRKTDLNDSERLILLKNNLQFVEENGTMVVKKNGEVLRDKNTQNPVKINQAIQDVFTERGWIDDGQGGGSGGRGGGSTPPGGGSGIKTMSGFLEKWKAENPGKNEISPEFHDAVAKHATENKDFDWNT